jgi:class 3 adenylate cyclase
MQPPEADNRDDLDNLTRLLLEDVCSDLVRFLHPRDDPGHFAEVRIDREWALGPAGSFADLRVEPEDGPPYFMEVKYGYDARSVLDRIQRKYGQDNPRFQDAPETHLILVIDTHAHADWPALEAALRAALAPSLRLEVWDEERLHSLMVECFGQAVPAFTGSEILALRECIDQGNERLAFGEAPPASYSEAVLRQNLLWQFGAWRLRELRSRAGSDDPRRLVPPASYEDVVAVTADLSGFSRYMHDTSDDAIVRQILTSFYAKARCQVINAGGMLLHFVGDSVVALFGIPDRRPGYAQAAVHTAYRLLDIAAYVSDDWQRRIDHVQSRRGAHIGMAMGGVQIVAMRPLDPARLAAFGDCLDITDRLMALAEPGEIVVSNVLHYALRNTQYKFTALEPKEVRSLGMLQPWRLVPKQKDCEPG